MPKPVNPLTSKEILEAAGRLLDNRSISAVTMRAVAEETGVAVTTIYDRFGDRAGLLRELAVHLAQIEAAKLEGFDILHAFEHYLDFAQVAPNRYKLLADTFFERLEAGRPLPGFELAKQSAAERLGGSPDDQEELALAVMQLIAGTVTALMAAGENRDHQARARRAAKLALDRLLEPRGTRANPSRKPQ